MSRVKRGVTSHAKHKKVLKRAKGFYGRRKNTIRTAKAAVDKAAQYAFRDRKNRKRSFRACGSSASTPPPASTASPTVDLSAASARPGSKSTARSWPNSP